MQRVVSRHVLVAALSRRLCQPLTLARRSASTVAARKPQKKAAIALADVELYNLEDDVTVSNQVRKSQRLKPSASLEHALAATGREWTLGTAPPSKIDLSYISPRTLKSLLKTRQGRHEARERLERREFYTEHTLQDVLARYIETQASGGVDAARAGCSGDDKALLASQGYGLQDLEEWATILTTQDSAEASEVLLAHLDAAKRPLPGFVFSFFLRRTALSPQAVWNSLLYAWKMVELLEQSPPGQRQHLGAKVFDRSAAFIIIVRLIRAARHSMPSAFLSIVHLHARMWALPANWSMLTPTKQRRTAQQIVEQHNELLKLLSIPCATQPYLNTQLQEVAQFDLLGRMADFRPPIPINREGYRAIARVQLASPKTEQERDWASLKVKSWPPWKEDKMGFDSEKTYAVYGVPRAAIAMRHAREAGYGSESWERVASIMSGWDVDHTPTIQKRAWVLHKSVNPSWAETIKQDDRDLWCARIKATRTAQEAWAFFLAAEDKGVPLDWFLYYEMLQKLGVGTLDSDGLDAHADEDIWAIQGGDTAENLPTPTSEREQVYTRKPVPSMDSLVRTMVKAGIFPSGRMLSFIVQHAETMARGQDYLEWGSSLAPEIMELVKYPREIDKEKLDKVPIHLVEAYLELLSRTVIADASRRRGSAEDDSTGATPKPRYEVHDPTFQALWLVRARAEGRASLWNSLLRAILHSRNARNVGHELEKWPLLQLVRRHMKEMGLGVDVNTFQALCRGAQDAALTASRLEKEGGVARLKAVLDGQPSLKRLENAADVFRTLGNYVRTLFYELYGTQDARIAKHSAGLEGDDRRHMPRLLAAPDGTTLMGYIRLQGIVQNYHAMLECVRWMCQHRREVEVAARGPRSGRAQRRRALIAARVFAERSWLMKTDSHFTDHQRPTRAAPAVTRSKLRELIESVKPWGGWPKEQEVDAYCTRSLVQRFDRCGIR